MQHAARLRGPVRSYDWGSRTAIAELQGRPTPTREPEAELWLGGHPRASAEVEVEPGLWRPLSDLVREEAVALLGERLAASWDGTFPFLLKVLAASRPLSVQAHPDRQRAVAGFRREEQAGLALDSPQRIYSDPYPKPELILALTPFRLLRGLRSAAELQRLAEARGFGSSLWVERIVDAASSPADLCRSWLSLGGDELARLLEALPVTGEDDADPVVWVRRLEPMHPGDPAVLAPLILGFELLRPGEAAFTPAGTLHAYLEGVGVELMVSSDNVVRGGLTSKTVDREELARVLSPAGPVAAALEERGEQGRRRLRFPDDELRLTLVEPGPGEHVDLRSPEPGPQILLCLEGEGRIEEGERRLSIRSGEAVLVPAAAEGVQAVGRMRLAVAGPGAGLGF